MTDLPWWRFSEKAWNFRCVWPGLLGAVPCHHFWRYHHEQRDRREYSHVCDSLDLEWPYNALAQNLGGGFRCAQDHPWEDMAQGHVGRRGHRNGQSSKSTVNAIHHCFMLSPQCYWMPRWSVPLESVEHSSSQGDPLCLLSRSTGPRPHGGLCICRVSSLSLLALQLFVLFWVLFSPSLYIFSFCLGLSCFVFLFFTLLFSLNILNVCSLISFLSTFPFPSSPSPHPLFSQLLLSLLWHWSPLPFILLKFTLAHLTGLCPRCGHSADPFPWGTLPEPLPDASILLGFWLLWKQKTDQGERSRIIRIYLWIRVI